MSFGGDDGREMPQHDPYDDGAIDAFLAGTSRDEASAAVSSFVSDVRAASEAVPTPSPALAAAIAAGGISSEVVTPIAPWRKLNMKIKGFLAGLSVAGKLALGVGVAAAATTGAGAAGVLPGPVQHALAKAVDAVSPFSLPDPEHHTSHDGDVAGGTDTTTTTFSDGTTTTIAGSGEHSGTGDGNGVVTPTTEKHNPDGTGDTSTTIGTGDGHHGDGGGSTGSGGGETPTTVGTGDGNHGGGGSGGDGGGDSNNPQSLEIHCERTYDPATIACSWNGDAGAGHASYALLRITEVGAPGHVICTPVDGQECVDTSVSRGTGYGYMVISLAADGHTVTAHSSYFTIMCCGDAPTTTTTEHHEPTTTTTIHHEPTTTTTEPHGDGTTTTTVH